MAVMDKIKLSVVIPAHNEQENIANIVTSLLRSYPKEIIEVVIVNDGSTDDTKKIGEKLSKKYKKVKLINRRPPNGVGLAIRDGVKSVTTEATHVLTMDADFIENVKDLKRFFIKIHDYDGLVGSRYLLPNSLIRYPAFKKFVNRAFHKLCRIFLGIGQKDLTNNFKFYKREIFKRIPMESSDFCINAETGIYPIIYKYEIGEIPVKWIGRTASMGVSKFKVLKVGPGYIKVLLKSFVLKHA